MVFIYFNSNFTKLFYFFRLLLRLLYNISHSHLIDKFDGDALSESFYVWATSPEPFPEGRPILPFFYEK